MEELFAGATSLTETKKMRQSPTKRLAPKDKIKKKKSTERGSRAPFPRMEAMHEV